MTADMKTKREVVLQRQVAADEDYRKLLRYRAMLANEGELPHNLKQAKIIAFMLDAYPAVVEPDDRLAGKFSVRTISDAEAAEVQGYTDYLWRHYRGFHFFGITGGVGGHRTIDFETLLTHGIQGLLDRIARQEANLTTRNPAFSRKYYFYAASRLVLAAVLSYAERCRQEALRLHLIEQDPGHKAALLEMAEILARVPRHPARTFHEALQSVWLVQFAIALTDDATCSGRPDRYLLPLYRRGLCSGSLSRARASALIEEFFWRSNETFGRWPETIMLGGSDAKGRPVQNELTTLFLEAIEHVGMVNPNVGLCVRDDTPDELLDLALDKIAKGFSHPSLYNDRVITAGLRMAGLSAAEACNYINSTCVEITPIGCSNAQVMLAYLYAGSAVTVMLNGGRLPLPDPEMEYRIGQEALLAWQRPAPEGLAFDLARFKCFDDFYAAFKSVIARVLRDTLRPAINQEYRRATYGSCPLVSCFTHDCITRGADVANGGARQHYVGVDVSGFSTAVDSLLAIREAIFNCKKFTLPALARALAANFDDCEPMRQFLMNRCPKYGEDDAAADALAKDFYDFIRTELSHYKTSLGGKFYVGIFSGWGGGGRPWAANVRAGYYAGATPDGRKATLPFSENIGPALGSDRKGLTALVNSVTKLDQRHGLGGISVNWRIAKSLMDSRSDRKKLTILVREFFRKGGFELQLNVIDTATLRAAQKSPEHYRTLMVRVAGYSDYFAAMAPEQQEELIARTEHT